MPAKKIRYFSTGPSLKVKEGIAYDLDYRCDTPGPDIEEGSLRAYWTGEIDTWGKLTLRPTDGRTPDHYLFPQEILSAEPVSDPELEEDRKENARIALEARITLHASELYSLVKKIADAGEETVGLEHYIARLKDHASEARKLIAKVEQSK